MKHRILTDPMPFVCELPNVEVLGPPALPIDETNRYVLECTEGSLDRLSDTVVSVLRNGQFPVRRHGDHRYTDPVASFVGFWSDGFYHWFVDYLPRIRGLEAYATETGTYPDLLVASDGPVWQRESLRLLGIPNEKIIEWDGTRARANQFVVPSIPRHVHSDSPSWGYSPSPNALKWLSDRVLEDVAIPDGGGNRILITRRSASSRRLHNERAVIESLSEHGFEPVDLTELPLKEQVRLFARAEAVVAPHGAGLINTIYGRHISIVELFGDYINACYYCIAGGLGHTYRYDLCDEVDGDLLVDVRSLESIVETAL